MSGKIHLWHVDAFAEGPFTGNPAAVCVLPMARWPSDRWLQGVASEMNLPETAFLLQRDDRERIPLRWFTPALEVNLCGHATLASVHVLLALRWAHDQEDLVFDTRGGDLACDRKNGLIRMDFPAVQPRELPGDQEPDLLVEALGVDPVYVGWNGMDHLAVLATASEVRSLRPDFRKLKDATWRGVMVTALSDVPQFDYITRFFAPAAGIDEDPVTGSAHCCLGPFWKERLGKHTFTALQASPRGGVVKVKVKGSRVLLGGKALTVSRGTLELAPDAG